MTSYWSQDYSSLLQLRLLSSHYTAYCYISIEDFSDIGARG